MPFPSTPGQQFPDTLRIGSNAPGTAQITVNLNQSAVGGALSYVGSGGGNSIAFLNVANTANGKSQFILRNSGNATVSFTSTLSNALFALNTTDQVLTANAAPSNIVFFKGTPGSTGNQSKVTLTLQGESVLCQPLPELLFFSPN